MIMIINRCTIELLFRHCLIILYAHVVYFGILTLIAKLHINLTVSSVGVILIVTGVHVAVFFVCLLNFSMYCIIIYLNNFFM